ncbi:hypothetical protein PybrP1_002952, partial [[Pythium] brassicae (nom. inval.)]
MGRQPGHRQRGAGTVTVSKGETERQGVLCKEWQRTPVQLLHEFCQSKKRRGAHFPRVRAPEGRVRVRCVLPDDKNAAKDLTFCPAQDFATLDEAKHCAALLALRHVEPLRPFERKLPDPYRELWLALAASGTGAAAGPADAKAAAPGSKSQAKKSDASPPAAAPAAAAAASTEADDSDSDGTLDMWGDAADAPPAADAKPAARRTLPTALSADRAFASHAEFEKARLERVQARNKKQRQRENRERANQHKHVFMSAACREMIEQVLRGLGAIAAGAGGDNDSDPDPNPDSSDAADAAAHNAFYAQVARQLGTIGFSPAQVHGALQACKKGPGHSDDAFMTLVLDWLCLNVPEGDLPKGFNPEGTQLDVVVTTTATGGKSASEPPAMSPVLVQRLMKYGYDRLDAVAVANAYLRSHPDEAGNESPSPELLLALLRALHPHVLRHFGVETITAADDDDDARPSADEVAAQRQDEILALEAIYDDKFAVQTLRDDARTQCLALHVSDDVQLEVFLSGASQYPFELPVIGLTTSNPSLRPFLVFAGGTALKSCAAALGEPMIYDICVAVDTILSECAGKKQPPRIVLLPHEAAPSPAASGATRPPPAPASAPTTAPSKPERKSQAAKKPFKKRSESRSAAKQADPAAVKRMSDALLQRRREKESSPGFQQMLRARAKLPAAAETESVVQHLQQSQVLLVCGQTGCGKTTQVPQFILDDYIANQRGGECNIVCTQPRRIAAIGVATRVAQERCEDVADVVGYQIRMEAKKSANTRLLFCTTGVLLRRLLSDRSLSGVSHIIVDEVHERNIDTDFLLSILRDLLPTRPTLRLILMSATMNADLFVNYFSSVSRSPCPVLDIPGFTYPVQVNFLDDILAMTAYDVQKKLLVDRKAKKAAADSAEAAPEPAKRLHELSPQELAERVDDSRIDYDLVAHLVTHLVAADKTAGGAILVFLPGTAEIKRLIEMLLHTSQLAGRILALPLHGSLSGADQALVFRSAPAGKTKIIRRSQLLDCWAAQAACDQRKGRAGRVQAGTCYRLFSRKRFASLDAQLSAEIHRVSLEQLCLQIKKLGLGSIRAFLAKAIEPPRQDAIDAAMRELVEIAAFQLVGDRDDRDDDGDSSSGRRTRRATADEEEVTLTPLGNHLAMLPLDARIGKFLVFGSILRCVEPVATIAACISSKSPFVMSMADPELRAKQDALKKELAHNWKSDHLLLWQVVERYSPLKGQKLRRGFCKGAGLSFDTLESILELRAQYLQQLGDIGFYDARGSAYNANAGVPRIVKAALCAGLYGNVAQVVYPEQKYFQSAHGVVTEDHDAKKIRYFIRSPAAVAEHSQHSQQSHQPFVPRERVFLHPSSCNFVQTQYDSPWLLYSEIVQTSKLFVRESTMVNPYALLLFGGKLEVVHEKNLLRLDEWVQFSAVARIGVLIKALRRHLDQLLTDKIENPALDIAQSELVSAISHLLKTE